MSKIPVQVFGYAQVRATVWIDEHITDPKKRRKAAMDEAETVLADSSWEIVEVEEISLENPEAV